MAAKDPAITPEALGKKLKETLHSYHQTPNWLAEQTGIGVRTIYSILNGHQLPSIDKLRRICSALNISVDWLFEIESDSFYIFPSPGGESRSYADFEEFWLGERGGERISVSRGFSIVHQPPELRRQILERIFNKTESELKSAMEAFMDRREVIDQLEKRRMEIVVSSEVEDFVMQRAPWDRVEGSLIREFIEGIIDRLENDPIGFEVLLIPRQNFLVNYEILNREVVLFDLGTVFLRQSHERIVRHFLSEVESFQKLEGTIQGRPQVIEFLYGCLDRNEAIAGARDTG